MQQLLYGLQITLIGMVIVFAGLIILIGCVKLLGIFTGSGKKAKPAEAPAPAAMPTPPPAAAVIAPATPAKAEDDTLIAVITAAVAAMWQGETGFTVRRVRRVHNSPAWHQAGREDQTYSRL